MLPVTPMLELWTDGSGTTADKPYGYGFVVVENGKRIAFGFGGGPAGTNNVAELSAMVKGMRWVFRRYPDVDRLIIKADSQYALKCFSEWRWSWEDRGFLSAEGKPIPNQGLIMAGCGAADAFRRYPRFEWVPGHAGIKYNEQCDQLANFARRNAIGGLVVWDGKIEAL